MEPYRRRIFAGIIIIALGITMMNTMQVGSIGIVFISLGGVFFISGMAKKREAEKKNEDE